MRTIFQWLRWVCLLLLALAWTTTSSFAAVGALNQANGGLTIRYDATETQNRGYDAEPLRAWDNNPPEMVDASAFFGSPVQFNAARGPVQAFEVGTADALKARSVVGDGLDIHHVAQAHPLEQVIPGYNRATGPAITVPRAQHSTIPTVRGPFTGTARDQLAKDIWDLRNYTDAPNSSLQDLINLNKQMYPGPYTK